MRAGCAPKCASNHRPNTAFTGALRRFRAAAGAHPDAVYELVSGGEPPTYVLWMPVKTWAESRRCTATGP